MKIHLINLLCYILEHWPKKETYNLNMTQI